jgi:hypothetical protein
MLKLPMITLILCAHLICVMADLWGQPTSWSPLKLGSHKVGFKTMRMSSKTGNPVLISIWYPAESETTAMTLADLITIGGARIDVPDSTLIREFPAPIKWMFDVNMDEAAYMRLIKIPTNTFRDAPEKRGTFPFIISLARPSSYFSTFEFLASHGFVVAGVDCYFVNDSPPGALHYSRYTDLLEELMSFMEGQDNTQKNSVSVFGHGFGINPALYLAMRTSTIKKAINFDGGFFGPRSNTTKSIDYHPERLNIPLLHVITQSQFKEDDASQFQALKNPITRVVIKSDVFKHQDVSAWGRLVTFGSRTGQDANAVNSIYVELHNLMLDFLHGDPLPKSTDALRIEKFN